MDDNSGWMGDVLSVNPSFGKIPINQIALPGSHDAGTYDMNMYARTQHRTIPRQLAVGIRYFDFRPMVKDDWFYIHHGVSPSDNVLGHWGNPIEIVDEHILGQLRKFLIDHPKEILILKFSDCMKTLDLVRFSDENFKHFIDLLVKYFTFPMPGETDRCHIVRLAKGIVDNVDKQTIDSLLAAGLRVFLIFDERDLTHIEAATAWAIGEYAFKSKGGENRSSHPAMVLWDPWWEDADNSLGNDNPANLPKWFEWHHNNILKWNKTGFLVTQSQMAVLGPGETVKATAPYYNAAERAAGATSDLQKDVMGHLISNNARNADRYISWLQSGTPINIVTFDFVEYGALCDKIIAYYMGFDVTLDMAQSHDDWSGRVGAPVTGITLGAAAQRAATDPNIDFFTYVKAGPWSLQNQGTFKTGTAIFFRGKHKPGVAKDAANMYVKRPK